MAITGFKINTLAKELNMKSKDLVEILAQNGFGANGQNPFANGFGGFGGFDFGDLGDLFRNMTGSGGFRRSTGPRRGNDFSYAIKISFMDAINGKSYKIPDYQYEKEIGCDCPGKL